MPDPLTQLDRRFSLDGDNILVFTTEQLSHIKGLISRGQAINLRMAVIILDHLAEVILHRRVENQIEFGDRYWTVGEPHYSLTKRKKIRRDFKAKIDAVLDYKPRYVAQLEWGEPHDILTRERAAILSIAHDYRNAIYHRDLHNARFLPLLARMQFVTVAEIFAASFPHHVLSSSHQKAKEYRARLAHAGMPLDTDDESFTEWEIAELCATQLSQGLSPPLNEVREVLESDIAERQQLWEDVIGALERDGLPREHTIGFVQAAELEERKAEDHEVMNLKTERARLIASSGVTKDVVERADAIEQQIQNRWKTLWQAFTPTVLNDADPTFERLIGHWTRASELLGVLETYRDLDEYMSRVERCLLRVGYEWDRFLDAEIDRLRGK